MTRLGLLAIGAVLYLIVGCGTKPTQTYGLRAPVIPSPNTTSSESTGSNQTGSNQTGSNQTGSSTQVQNTSSSVVTNQNAVGTSCTPIPPTPCSLIPGVNTSADILASVIAMGANAAIARGDALAIQNDLMGKAIKEKFATCTPLTPLESEKLITFSSNLCRSAYEFYGYALNHDLVSLTKRCDDSCRFFAVPDHSACMNVCMQIQYVF